MNDVNWTTRLFGTRVGDRTACSSAPLMGYTMPGNRPAPPAAHRPPPGDVSATWQMIRDRATSRLQCRAESREDAEIMTFTPIRADGPLAVSSRNPRYFTPIAGPRAGRAVYLTGSHIWNNLHDGMGPGRAGAPGLRRLLAVPGRAGAQLHPALALGAGPVPGGGRELPPQHDAAAVVADR